MAILTPSDAAIYAPDVTLTGDALDAALLYIQSLIESGKGAARPLEFTSFTERKDVNFNAQTVYFTYIPVLDDPAPVVRVRAGNVENMVREVIPVGEWKTLESDVYTIDVDGRLNFGKNFYNHCSYNFYRGFSYFQRLSISECELTYSSGYDFSTNTPEINQIKASAGRILSYCYGNSGNYQGVKRLKVPFREFEVEWSDKQSPGTIPDELFLPFVKYRPLII